MKTLTSSTYYRIFVYMIVAILFSGCPDKENPITPSENNVELGTETQLSQTQQGAGSVVTISK
ncbi:MAG: hypothetical protein JNJ85_15925, partial [Candidatus Kapabacteria bacterium]|nr:hypothetical protein [Candidatus Kapabacteria bacterium]